MDPRDALDEEPVAHGTDHSSLVELARLEAEGPCAHLGVDLNPPGLISAVSTGSSLCLVIATARRVIDHGLARATGARPVPVGCAPEPAR